MSFFQSGFNITHHQQIEQMALTLVGAHHHSQSHRLLQSDLSVAVARRRIKRAQIKTAL